MTTTKVKYVPPSPPMIQPEAEEGDRTSRYASLIDPQVLGRAAVLVVGVGAVGRQAAIQLCSMGVGSLRIVDFDTVSTGNLGPQGWMEGDVGMPKVEALKRLLNAINPRCVVEAVNGRFERPQVNGADYILACADNMEVRKDVVEASEGAIGVRLVVDTRMGLEVCRTYHIFDEASRAAWHKTWFPQSEAEEAPCGRKATVYCASAAGALACVGVFKEMTRRPLPHAFEFNMGAHMGMATWPETEPAQEEVASA